MRSILVTVLLVPLVLGQLNQWAKDAGLLYFGTAMSLSNVRDAPYYELQRNNSHFGQWTPENDQKWGEIQPQPGVFAFANSDAIYRRTRCNRQFLRCHTLVWHSQLPAWVEKGVWTAETLLAVMETHIRTVMTHFKGKCYAWDVVNEGLEDNGTYRRSVFYDHLGEDYFAKAFKIAGEVDPGAKLYYNDYNLEYFPVKADAAVRIVKMIQAAGAPIHGVGLQGHMTIGRTPSRENLTWTLNKYTALGLDVAYTELDVRIRPMPSNATSIEMQAQEYANLVGSCLDVARCVGITVWSFGDAHSWIPGAFPNAGDANLYDHQVKPKPALYSVSAVLAAGRPTALPTP